MKEEKQANLRKLIRERSQGAKNATKTFSTLVETSAQGEQAVLFANQPDAPMQPISLSRKPKFTQIESWRCVRAIVDVLEAADEVPAGPMNFFDFNAGAG